MFARFSIPFRTGFLVLSVTATPTLAEQLPDQKAKRVIVFLKAPTVTDTVQRLARRGGRQAVGKEALRRVRKDQDRTIRKFRSMGISKKRILRRLTNVTNALVLQKLTRKEELALRKRGYELKSDADYNLRVLLPEVRQILKADVVNRSPDPSGNLITGKGVRVAVIDGGLDFSHPAFARNRIIDKYDFFDSDSDPTDSFYHGTAVTGVVGASGPVQGIAPDVEFQIYRACGTIFCSASALLAAMDRALDPNGDGDFSDKADVVNISIGGSGNPDDVFSAAVDRLSQNGVTVVAAAENDGPSERTITSPACARTAIAVGNTVKQFDSPNLARDSSRGLVIWTANERFLLKPDVVAPGENVCAPVPSGVSSAAPCSEGFRPVSGTSFAAPAVTGVVALMKQAHRDLDPSDVKSILRATSARSGYLAREGNRALFSYGFGLVNAEAAVALPKPKIKATIAYTDVDYSRGRVLVFGSAMGPAGESYTLSHRSPSGEELVFGSGSTPKTDELLGEFDISNLEQGVYQVALAVAVGAEVASDLGVVEFERVKILSPRSITFPNRLEAHSAFISGRTKLTVRAAIRSSTPYQVFWCKDGNCSAEGIALLPPPPVEGGAIATWDLPSLRIPNGLYTIRVHVPGAGTDEAIVILDNDLMATRPHDGAQGGSGIQIQDQTFLTAFDVDNDGASELIYPFGAYTHQIRYSGDSFFSFPKWFYGLQCNPVSTKPIVGDFHSSSGPELLVQDGCATYLFNMRGQFIRSLDGFGGYYSAAARLASEEYLDLAGFDRRRIKPFSSNGAQLPGAWPLPVTNIFPTGWLEQPITIYPPLPERNFLGGKARLVVSSRDTVPNASGDRASSVALLNYRGELAPGWPKVYTGSMLTPKVFDVNGDRRPEIVLQVSNFAAGYNEIHAYDIAGENIPGFPLQYRYTDILPAFASGTRDLFEGSVLPIRRSDSPIPDLVTTKGSCVIVFSNGRVKPGWPQCQKRISSNPLDDVDQLAVATYEDLTLGNIDLDDEPEILVKTNAGFIFKLSYGVQGVIAYNLDGSVVDGFPKVTDDFPLSNFVVADLDGDGLNEIAVLDFNWFYVWKTKGRAGSFGDQWNQEWGNTLNTNSSILQQQPIRRDR